MCDMPCDDFRTCRKMDASFFLLGTPHNSELLVSEKDLLARAGIDLPHQSKVVTYPSLLLTKSNRVLRAKTSCRAIKRNNSCLRYSSGCGLLQKIIVFNNTCYLVVNYLNRASLRVCQDDLTYSKFDDHFCSFYPPRFVSQLQWNLVNLNKLGSELAYIISVLFNAHQSSQNGMF